MSIPFKKEGLFLGDHAMFAEEGPYIPSLGGEVDSEHIPSGDPIDLICWEDLGHIVSMKPTIDVETDDVTGPNPCFQETVDEVVKKVSRVWKMKASTITKLGKELADGTDLDPETGEGVIDSKPMRRGWLIWSGVNQRKVLAVTRNIWGNLRIDGEPETGHGSFTQQEYSHKQLSSPLNNKVKYNV